MIVRYHWPQAHINEVASLNVIAIDVHDGMDRSLLVFPHAISSQGWTPLNKFTWNSMLFKYYFGGVTNIFRFSEVRFSL